MIHDVFQGVQHAAPTWLSLLPAILFGTCWLFCLVHAVCKRAFYPVFHRAAATRTFWVATFFFFSPALLTLYFVFGIVWPPGGRPAWWRTALVLVPALAIAVVTLGAWSPQTRDVVIAERNQETGELSTPDRPAIDAHLGVQRARMATSSAMGTAHGREHSTWAFSSVWIQELEEHPLLRETAHALHAGLAGDRRINRLGWGPPGKTPPPGERAYDFYVLLSLPEASLISFPGYRTAVGTLVAQVGTTPYPGSHSHYDTYTPPLMKLNGNIKVRFDSVHFGLETPAARYARPGGEIAENIIEKVDATLADLRDKQGPPSVFPDFCFGPMREAPSISFPDDAEVSVVSSAYGLLNHNHTVWTVSSDAAPEHFMEVVYQRLAASGWQGRRDQESCANAYFRMRDGEDIFWIERDGAYPMQPGEGPGSDGDVRYIAHYVDRYGDDEYPPLLETLLASDPSEAVLLAFQPAFVRNSAKDVFYQHFASRSFQSMEAAMVMARYYQDGEEPSRAEAMVRRAEVLSWFEPHGNKPSRKSLETLLEDLQLQPLEASNTAPAVLRTLGMAPIPDERFPIVRELPVGQPLIVPGPEERELWGVKVAPLDGTEEWQYVVVHIGQGHSWESSNFSAPAEGGRLKQWRQSIGMSREATLVDITVDRSDGGQLLYTIQPVNN